MALFNLFNPDTPAGDVALCLANPTAECDSTTIGSTILGVGYCKQNPQSIICGCVNNSLPCPQKLSPYCGKYAYHPTTEASQGVNCPTSVCVNSASDVSETSGNSGDIIQACGMASISSSGIIRYLFFHPLLVLVILFILIAVVNVAVYKYATRKDTNVVSVK